MTLHQDNLLWLRTRVKVKGDRSLSEALDAIITEARAEAGPAGEVRSVVGQARIPKSEKALSEAAEQIAALFRGPVGRGKGVRPRRGRSARPAAPRRERA